MMGDGQAKNTFTTRFLILCGLVLAADQVSKEIMLALLFDPPRLIKINLFLNLVPVWNPGMSFGLLADGGVAVRIGLTILAFVVSGWLFWMLPQLDRLQRVAAALIAAGAIGNAIDRLRFGRVVDFIDLHWGGWHWPAFNVADAAITTGAVLWACQILLGQEADKT